MNLQNYNTIPNLVLASLPCRLQYALKGYPGFVPKPWLDEQVNVRLIQVDRFVREVTKGKIQLLILDALRSKKCQVAIFNNLYKQGRQKNPNMKTEDLKLTLAKFVSDANEVFRHATGGAVDVTFMENGKEVDMGASYDDFLNPRTDANYYYINPPRTVRDRKIHWFRKLLIDSMEAVGFVCYKPELFHHEYGTPMWGELKQKPAFLTTIIDPPNTPSFSAPTFVSTNSQRQTALVNRGLLLSDINTLI